MRLTANLSRRLWRVWARNALVYMRTWRVNFLPPLAEPALYILAFGAGLGGLVGEVESGGARVSYTAFIAPGLLAASMMWQSFYETTYSSFVRMYYQKTFDAMLATPLSLEDVITAEIVWGATKSVAATVLTALVVAAFGFVRFPEGLWLVPLAALGGLAFACPAMWITGIIPSIEMFNLPVFLVITPMFLFSGAFFPIEGFPGWAVFLAKVLPLYHLTRACRWACLGGSGLDVLASVAYLALVSVVFYPLAIAAMRKRLVK